MAMFKNDQKISKIVFSPKEPCHNFCPLGQLYCNEIAQEGEKPKLAHYTNHFTITFYPNALICDYCDVEKWVRNNLNDRDLIIEDCVSMLFDYINDTYKPKYLLVESFVDDAVHGPVTISRETKKKENL